jgi:hypothetical protein
MLLIGFRSTLIGVAALLFGVSLALAQALAPPPPPPPLLDSLPASTPPPLPPIEVNNPDLEPQVTIVKREGETVEEHRINGMLYMMKVTPVNGVSYYLIDNRGDGIFTRQQSLDSGLRVPQWVLFKF